MSFDIVNPLEIPEWDDLVLATGKASIFHSSAWARVLYESYGYRPVYFAAIEGGSLSFLMPFMEVNSRLTGKRGVSLPFTDFCDPISANGKIFGTARNAVTEYGKDRGWKTAEWRGGAFGEASPCASYLSHVLELGKSEEQVFSGFKSSTRRNINKAGKEGVRIEMGSSLKSMESYYRLHCGTRRDHGLPPQPFSFFRKIHDLVIAKGFGFTALAFLSDVCVAGGVYFHFGETAIYKFGASNRNYQHLRPNNLVMWEAIRECMRGGCRHFSFGRTEPDNEGLLQFKRGWGTTENELHYYSFDFRKKAFVGETKGLKGFHNRIFSVTPIPVLRILGSTLYKHLG
jgi:hypothetical protein